MLRSVGEIATVCGGKIANCSKNTNVSIFVNNDKDVVENCLYVAINGEKYDGAEFARSAVSRGAAVVLCEKEISDLPCIVCVDVCRAICRIAAFYREKELKKVVAVTGSYGKTTVKELCALTLSKKYSVLKNIGNKNNLIGVPLTLLSNTESTHAVLELGISEKGEMERLSEICAPDEIIITGIGTMHSATLGTRQEIAAEKLKILSCATKNAPIIIPENEPLLNNGDLQGAITVALNSDTADFSAYNLRFAENGTVFDVKKRGKPYMNSVFTPIIGSHGAFDSLFAVALAHLHDISEQQLKKALSEYKPIGNRQNIFIKNGISVMADCYNFGPESAMASLEAFDILRKHKRLAKSIVFFGSMLELGDISEREHLLLGRTLARYGFDVLVTLGDLAYGIARGASEGGMKEVFSYGDFEREDAFEMVYSLLSAGSCLLIKGSRKMKMEEVIPLIGEN